MKSLHKQNYILIYKQAAWFLKTRALTEQVFVDEVEVDEEGIAEVLMDDTAIAQVARELFAEIFRGFASVTVYS